MAVGGAQHGIARGAGRALQRTAAALCASAALLVFASDANGRGADADASATLEIREDAAERVASARSATERGMALLEEAPERAQAAFIDAAEQWEALIDAGYGSFAVRFNAGNARLRLGQADRALAHYLSAQRLEPRSAALRDNLVLARAGLAAASAGVADEGGASPWDAVVSVARWLTLRERLGIFVAAWAILWIALMARRKRPGSAFVSTTTFVSASAFVLAAAMIAVDGWDAMRPTAVVVDEPAELRRARSGGFAPTGGSPLEPGEVVRVDEVRAAWIRVETASGRSGWIERSAAMIVDDGRWPFATGSEVPAIRSVGASGS